jgi:hypothetical protein
VLLVDTRTFADPPHPDDAIALLAALPMQAIVFAFTTTSYVLGPDGEQALKARCGRLNTWSAENISQGTLLMESQHGG